MAYIKPLSPLKLGEDHIYPLTTYDQIIMKDGSRWNGKVAPGGGGSGELDVELEGEPIDGEIVVLNADQLGGRKPNEYVLRAEISDNLYVKYADIILYASNWNENKQTIQIEGIAATTNGEAFLAQNITAEQFEAATSAMLHVTGQDEGHIEITAFGEVPAVDIPVAVKVVME